MLSKELQDEVLALDEVEKLELLRLLLSDPAMSKYAFDPMGLRGNYEIAAKLMKIDGRGKVKERIKYRVMAQFSFSTLPSVPGSLLSLSRTF